MRSRIAGDRSSSSRIIPNSSINGQRAEAFNSFAMASGPFGWRTSTSNPPAAWHRRNWSRAAGSMRRTSQVVVLVEDKRQQRFVRRYLYRLGYTRHDIQFEPVPGGEGSGAKCCPNLLIGRAGQKGIRRIGLLALLQLHGLGNQPGQLQRVD